MCSLLESFFDTMDELHVDFRRRLERIEREAWPGPAPSTSPEGEHTSPADKFEEIRYPLGLRPLWTDAHVPAESLKSSEQKGFADPAVPRSEELLHAGTIVRVMKRQEGTIRRD